MSGSLRGWKVPPLYPPGHPGWCIVGEAHNREDCRPRYTSNDPAKPFMANEEDRRWSNTYLKVDLIEDPKLKLRSLRTFLAGELWQHRRLRHEYRLRANDDIDVGWSASARKYSELIGQENAVLAELRRVAKELEQ